jgi:DNA-binding NarL/FixJ family response regulator
VAVIGWQALLGKEARGVSETDLDYLENFSEEELQELDTFEDGLIVRLRQSGLCSGVGVKLGKLPKLAMATSDKLLLVVDSNNDWPLLVRLRGHGVKYLCPMPANVESMLSTFQSMLNGDDASNCFKLAEEQMSTHRQNVSELGGERALTSRETDVVMLLTTGLTNKQIAAQLGISYETVKEHVQHILRKLDCKDRTSAAVKVARTIFPVTRLKRA